MTCKEKILSNEFADLITDYLLPLDQVMDELDYCRINVKNEFNISYVNRQQIPPISVSEYIYQHIPKLYGLMKEPFDTFALDRSGITPVQREPLALTGNGVVLGLIDTGIQYTQEAFLNAAGNSRILSIWDQTIQDGVAPKGLEYGTEYSREQINKALKSLNPRDIVPSWDENGHGTAMASIAAGSRIKGEKLSYGAAPDADLVVVKLKECKPYMRDYYLVADQVPAYAENDIMLAISYLERFAVVFHRPLVICLGIGTNFGDHSGSSALSAYLNNVARQKSIAVVVCGGNEGNMEHHYRGNLLQNINSALGEASDVVEIRVGENNKGFLLEMWGNLPDILQVSIRSPGGEMIPSFPLGLEHSVTYGFVYEKTKITIDSILVEESSGKELITFRFVLPTMGIWSIIVRSLGKINNGIFDFWLPITEFLHSETYFLRPDPYNTLTEPGMASEVITTSTYNDSNNSFYIASGRGFSTNNERKPDFASPGVEVSTILGSRTGSSLAAAITAGACAQFMQWAVVQKNAPLASTKDVKNYFIRGAKREKGIVYPNREWGYGRLDVEGTFNALIGI